MLRRTADKRKDSKKVRKRIKHARKQVFEKGRSLKSEKLKALLDYQSLNPIQVSVIVLSCGLTDHADISKRTVRVLCASWGPRGECLRAVCPRPDA